MSDDLMVCHGFLLETEFASIRLVSFTLRKGTIIQLFGLSDSGLDDVFYSLSGLLPVYRASRPAPDGHVKRLNAVVPDSLSKGLDFCGRPLYDMTPSERASQIGCIYEDPGLAIVGETVLEDFRYSFAAIGKDSPNPQVLMRYGLYKKLDRSVDILSGGERQRLNCASALEIEPKLIVANFTNANLDHEFMVDIKRWLVDLARSGTGVIVCGLRPNDIQSMQFSLKDGVFAPAAPDPSLFPSCDAERESLAALLTGRSHTSRSVLSVDTIRRPQITEPVSFELYEHEVLFIHGPNGVGKTTLGKILTGQVSRRDYAGNFVPHDGLSPVRSHQYPERTFIRSTVRKEAGAWIDLLPLIGLCEPEFNVHPRCLSRAKQKLLSILITLAASKGYAILDEPTCGLDFPSKRTFVNLVNHFSDLAILVFTHDEALLNINNVAGVRYQAMGG